MDLGAKLECLTKAGLDRIPVVAPLMIMVILLCKYVCLISSSTSLNFQLYLHSGYAGEIGRLGNYGDKSDGLSKWLYF